MMRRTRILVGLILAFTVPAVPAKAAPDDPFLVYVANREVTKGQSPWPVILRADAATGTLTEVSRNGGQGNLFVHPYDLAVAPDGGLIVVDMGQFASDSPAADGAVVRVDPTTGVQSLVSRGGALVDPAGVAIAPDGALFVVENVGEQRVPAVIRIDPRSGAQSTVTQAGELCNPFGIAFEPGGDLVVADYGSLEVDGRPIVECPTRPTGALIRVEPSTGSQTLVSEGGLFRSPFGLAVRPDGGILVANEGVAATAAVVAVDPSTGEQRTVTANVADDLFRFPERIALAPNGHLFVSDFQLADRFGGVIRVAPGDGAQSIAWQGELFSNPLGLAVVVSRPPVAALAAAPAMVAGGRQVTFDASASRDPEGLALRYDWDLDGDGAFERRTTTPTASRTYEGSQALSPQVRVRDPHGGAATAGAAVTVDATAPVVGTFVASARTLMGRATPRRGRAGPGSGSRSRAAPARAARSTTFSFRLSEPASVSIRIERAMPGRRDRGRCHPPGRRAVPRRARCTTWRHVVVLSEQKAGGAGRVRFSGRVRGRRLLPGQYRATAGATDVVGNRAQQQSLRLRVVEPKRQRSASGR
jgi:DNA-binding beta-propeller fold protein YncE